MTNKQYIQFACAIGALDRATERKAENVIGLFSQAQFDAQQRAQRPSFLERPEEAQKYFIGIGLRANQPEARLRKKVDSVVIESKQIN